MTHDHDSTPVTPNAGTPDCERALAEVYTFLDQELNEAHRTEIMAHLEACSPCFEAFDFEAELRMVITTKTHSVEVPETLRIRIEEKLTYLRIQGSGAIGSDDGGEPGRGA
jgi:mycothiol system anti-sigma-R factor